MQDSEPSPTSHTETYKCQTHSQRDPTQEAECIKKQAAPPMT
jgi:hypothetical protein